MNRLTFVKFVATSAASLGLVGGMSAVAFAHPGYSGKSYGKGSTSVVLNTDNGNVSNKNNVGASNVSEQNTQSGPALVVSSGSQGKHGKNSDVSSSGSNAALSGDVSATVTQGNSVDISSSASAMAPSVMPDSTSGGSSDSLVVNLDNGNVSNDNNVSASNYSTQNTQSGPAVVAGSSTSGSSASSGDASSTANQQNSITISE